VGSTRALDLLVLVSAAPSPCLTATIMVLSAAILTQQRASLDAPVKAPLVDLRNAIRMPNRHTATFPVTSTHTRAIQSVPLGKQAFSRRSCQVAQSKPRLLCTLTSRTMQEESITTSQEAWQVVTLSRWLDGVLRMVRSTGRSQTLGTHIGARRVTSASAVETMRVASRMVLSHLVLLQSGGKKSETLVV